MKKISLLTIMLCLLTGACQLTAGGGLRLATPTARLTLPTATATVGVSATIVSPAALGHSPTPDNATANPTATKLATSPPVQPTQAVTQLLATPSPCPVRVEWPEYIIQAGDTLFQIALRAGTTVDELVVANCFNDGSHIFAGQLLRVPPTFDEPDVFPTHIPDGSDLVIYPGDTCFSPPFTYDPGVSAGERWRVATELELLTLWDGPHSNAPAGLLQRGEHFWVQEGPACYTQIIGNSQLAFRRWRVRSEQRELEGWIDDRDPFTDFATIEPRPIVRHFDVFPRVVKTGEPITVAWEVEGANEVSIFSYHGLHRFGSGQVGEDPQLPPVGTLTVTAPIPLTSIQYSIGFAPEDPEHWVRVTIQCTETFFADVGDAVGCPLGPAESVAAVFQPFERGFMLWRRDANVNRVWVMGQDGGSSQVFGDYWAGEEITFIETPPAGLIQPVRGFGKVWVENDWVRQSLGWATAAEQAYTMEIQKTQTSYATYRFALTLPDGQLINASVSMGNYLTWTYTSRR